MSNLDRLVHELDRVSLRYRQILRSGLLAVCWLILALIAAALQIWSRPAGLAVVALLALGVAAALGAVWYSNRKHCDNLWIARKIEHAFPDLDTRLLAALEQRSDRANPQLGFLQESVILEALDHARRTGWDSLVPQRALQMARWSHNITLALAALLLLTLIANIARQPRSSWWTGQLARTGAGATTISIEPGDTSIERGTSLLVLARFDQHVPADVQLLYRDPQGQTQQMPMSRSLGDPLFAARIASVDRDMTYAVRYADAQTKWYQVKVFDYPDLRQADARLKYPQYTRLPEKLVEDTRSITAVEGTSATITFHLNKPVVQAQLVPSTQPAVQPLRLTADRSDPTRYSTAINLKQSQSYRLQLVDSDGRANKQPPELVINVTQNRVPDLKLEFPGHDVDASPIEELSVKAKVADDFGVARVGLSYALAGKVPVDVELARDIPGNQARDIAHIIPLEKLSAKPDELLSYHLWVEDFGPDGKIRRTSGDMFFAEVRPFDQIFRQGQQPSGDQQQQQQQRTSGNAQQAEQLAELQKQIIAATWKVIRRETSPTPSSEFAGDVTLIASSQSQAKEQGSALGERVRDDRSRTFLSSALKNMDSAIEHLNKARQPAIAPLPQALTHEQAAYQDLLKLRAREHEVVRGNQQQQRQQGGQSSAANRRQRQLDQLDLQNQQNRYATERSAQPQQEDAQQRETRQVLNRLRELAQRQEDLNKQMRELESQLAQAKQEAQREEIQRQLARLRDQQQQMLRDTDELRDRMDRPENQQRMADSRQQLERTRENVRRASESLQRNMVPEAASAGARAAEQLNNMREQVRSAAAGQFSEAMDRMRQDARQLDQNQQDLSQRLSSLDGAERRQQQQQSPPRDGATPGDQQASSDQPRQQRTLRDSQERQQVAQELDRQKQDLQKLLDNMRKTVEQAENAEPLLSRQLYDAARQANQAKTDQALDVTKKLLERGFVNDAQKLEGEAGKSITQLRKGVEKAAEGVLGDEAEALRRARGELDSLTNALDREMQRAGAGGLGATTQRSGERAANAGAATQPGERQFADGRGATTRGSAGATTQPGDRQFADGRGATTRGFAGATTRPDGQTARGQNQDLTPRPAGRGGATQPSDAQAQSGQRNPQQQGQANPQQQQSESVASANQPNRAGQRGGLRPNRDGQRGGEGELRQFLDQAGSNTQDGRGGTRAADDYQGGPLTGNFQQWSDRLRDVEEMVGDPRLRAEAARVRDRARAMRVELDRHSKEPNWDLVREFVGRPLVELRDKVAEELMRRGNAEAMVPIDREPVPVQYSEQVQKYYEKLGSGR